MICAPRLRRLPRPPLGAPKVTPAALRPPPLPVDSQLRASRGAGPAGRSPLSNAGSRATLVGQSGLAGN